MIGQRSVKKVTALVFSLVLHKSSVIPTSTEQRWRRYEYRIFSHIKPNSAAHKLFQMRLRRGGSRPCAK